MFCIAAFIVLIFLSIFSAKYRKLAGNAWKCVARKTTFRKCDTSFKEDTKSMLLGKLIITRPRLAKFLDKWLDVIAFIFVALTIWSLAVVIKSGINLYVYDTCNPNNSESCSIGAEACSITSSSIGFWGSLRSGDIIDWTKDEVSQFGETLSRIPDRMKKWQPRQYTDEYSSYYNTFDESKPVALEVIDPGCIFCANLFKNTKEAKVEQNYNLTYIAYPIPDNIQPSGYKFPHSYHIVSYLEAIKLHPKNDVYPTADWQILERLFTWIDESRNIPYQQSVNSFYNEEEVDNLLASWLQDFGYSDLEIEEISKLADSQEVKDRIAEQKRIVDDEIKTVKIPTVLLDTRRFDGVVEASKLD